MPIGFEKMDQLKLLFLQQNEIDFSSAENENSLHQLKLLRKNGAIVNIGSEQEDTAN